eukprot:4999431-Amphidinium_carterae.1
MFTGAQRSRRSDLGGTHLKEVELFSLLIGLIYSTQGTKSVQMVSLCRFGFKFFCSRQDKPWKRQTIGTFESHGLGGGGLGREFLVPKDNASDESSEGDDSEDAVKSEFMSSWNSLSRSGLGDQKLTDDRHKRVRSSSKQEHYTCKLLIRRYSNKHQDHKLYHHHPPQSSKTAQPEARHIVQKRCLFCGCSC